MVRLIDAASFAMAMLSIFLYSSLAITCIYFASKFWDYDNGQIRQGRYVAPKFIFFIVLGIAAILDLPTFIGCALKGGPSSCEWAGVSNDFCWLLATCGQLFAVITPSILWSDIIQHKDGNFCYSTSPLDSVKRFFRVFYILYCGVVIMTILGVAFVPNSTETTQVSDCLMPIMLVTIAAGCLYSGINLQRHVIKVHLSNAAQSRFLLQLNFLMLFITCTYALRAVMVLALFGPMPNAYQYAFYPLMYYPVWLPLTQWLPFIVCSFLLVANMRFKSTGNDRNSQKSFTSTDFGKAQGIDLCTVSAILEEGMEANYSTSERGTEASADGGWSHDHHSRSTRTTGVSVDGYGERSISYLLSQVHQSGGQSLTMRLHHDGTAVNPLSAGALGRDTDASARESDMYSAFGVNDQAYMQEHFRDTSDSVGLDSSFASAATGTDNFHSLHAALQRPISQQGRQTPSTNP